MKKGLLVLMAVFFLVGCAGVTAKEATYLDHNSHFASWDHMKFSLWGYKSIDKQDVEKSQQQGWWGKEYIGIEM